MVVDYDRKYLKIPKHLVNGNVNLRSPLDAANSRPGIALFICQYGWSRSSLGSKYFCGGLPQVVFTFPHSADKPLRWSLTILVAYRVAS